MTPEPAPTPAPELPPEVLALMAFGPLLPDPLPSDPMPLFRAWFDEEQGAGRVPNPNAMALGTSDASGAPGVRMVLCRGIDPTDGSVTFFTNYESDKSRALLENPVAAATFHWDHLERQARLVGPVVKASEAESDAYFASRRWESRIGAWASAQSRPIASREELFERVALAMAGLGLDPAELMTRGGQVHIPRPPFWGGWRILIRSIELWQGGPGRLHDRARWEREAAVVDGGLPRTGPWRGTRLQP